MTNANDVEGEWRLSENTGYGSEAFKWRIIAGTGREARPVAIFMHLTDAENAVADHQAAARVPALEALLARADGELFGGTNDTREDWLNDYRALSLTPAGGTQ